MAELSMAVHHVHSLGYIHRDIKPDNILIDLRGHLRLSDLGLCKKLCDEPTHLEKAADDFNHGKAYSVVGTPDYIAPEVLLQDGYGTEADLWSMGVIMYECLVGYTPFHDSNIITTCKNIVQWRDVLRFPANRCQHLSVECRNCMESLLCDAPERIGSKDQIKELMQHKWSNGAIFDLFISAEADFISYK
jgi:serine/threonine kinase 38